jgi:tetratricopeptide (TPR) repeat protein
MTRRTDYELELERIDRDLAERQSGASTALTETARLTKYAYRLYQRASLTGDPAAFATAEAAIDGGLERVGPWPDLCQLKAQLDSRFHRLAAVRQDLAMVPGLTESAQGRALLADLAMQEGRYDEARTVYETVVREHRTWDNLARLGHLRAKMGDVDGAERLYAEAVDELSAKEMRAYAWVELQCGLLDLSRGRHDEASVHYERAGRAYSGYWLVDTHVAELLGAQGSIEDAVALYEDVVARVPAPELQQALGNLYVRMGQPDRARPWHDRALAAYLESARRGDVHYFHHLADFYADVREDGPEAVRWARKDLALRQNASTHTALAWGLYRDGRLHEALDAVHPALSSGVKDADLFFRAGTMHVAAGRTGEGERLLHQAAEINPHYLAYHAHH